jgi:hypothetical protein
MVAIVVTVVLFVTGRRWTPPMWWVTIVGTIISTFPIRIPSLVVPVIVTMVSVVMAMKVIVVVIVVAMVTVVVAMKTILMAMITIVDAPITVVRVMITVVMAIVGVVMATITIRGLITVTVTSAIFVVTAKRNLKVNFTMGWVHFYNQKVHYELTRN